MNITDLRKDYALKNLDEKDARGYSIMDYQTSIAFGMAVKGLGHYRHSVPLRHSSFEFDSDDWKSIIRAGKGLWLYEPRPEGTYFKTVYDYEIRHGLPGRIADRLLFRPLLRLATEWGFESLRLWCAGDEGALVRRRSRLRFLAFFVGRALGTRPAPGSARSWLGTGGAGEELE